MPDRNTDSTPLGGIGWYTKTGLQTVLENQYASTGGDGVWNHNPSPGVIISLIGTSDGGSCPGGATCNPNYTTSNYRSLNPGGFGFEFHMGCNMCSWMHEMGMLQHER